MTNPIASTADEHPLSEPVYRHIARIVLISFLLTFIASRVMVILIMERKVPDFFLHAGGTHVHHLNYGIFLLSGVGAYLLFRRPGGRSLTVAAVVYSIGLALTFDEFGMWLHLGGSYWQRASFDAVVVIAALLGLISYAPSPRQFRGEHWIWTAIVTLVVLTFTGIMFVSMNHYATRMMPHWHDIEAEGPQ
jgi:ATP/ADP translocase